ncbi:MAG TPA: ABC transporter substrate-binding protein [Jatrophihabitans sp.]|nr:ABC transporter substrate-binding protein [Jatrophihabitans sp.]
MTAPSPPAGARTDHSGIGRLDSGYPGYGGTLRLYGPGDIDHLDPAVAGPQAREVLRLLSRQLLTYQPNPDLRNWQSVAPVPDVAVAVPSTYNAGLGASHRSYVLHLRPRVLWDTSPPRAVTAQDFVRGFKRLASPVARSAALTFLRGTVRGMAEFCDGYAAAVPPTATAERFAAYQNEHEIAGIFPLDDQTLVIELLHPALDFVHLLTLAGAAAAPVEYDAFVPDSPELYGNLRSNGPYRVTRYLPGSRLRLEPNPAWLPESDPVRGRQLDAIEITVEPATPDEIAARIEAGLADLPWGSAVRGRSVDRRAEPVDRRAEPVRTLSWDLDPYLVFNLAGGAAALGDLRVRRAIETALDKDAIAQLYRRRLAGVEVRVANSIVPPNNDGHQDLPAEGRSASGDPERARALLDEAGYRTGLTLTAVYELAELDPDVVDVCAAALARAGITVRPVGLDRADYHRLVHHRQPAPDWDLTVRSRSADWHYHNGRAFLQSMFETGAGDNLGGFSDPDVDDSIRRALAAATDAPSRAVAAWHEVQRRVLDQVAAVPILFRAPAGSPCRGYRVRNAIPMPALGYRYDLAALWLDAPAEGSSPGARQVTGTR